MCFFLLLLFFFFFNDTATTEIYTLSLHDALPILFHRDYKLDDGRWNNNGWLQELPDPITKIVWDGMVLMSRKTAEELGVESTTESRGSDVVEVELSGRKIRGPVWVQPGFADYSIGLTLGYGRSRGEKG